MDNKNRTIFLFQICLLNSDPGICIFLHIQIQGSLKNYLSYGSAFRILSNAFVNFIIKLDEGEGLVEERMDYVSQKYQLAS